MGVALEATVRSKSQKEKILELLRAAGENGVPNTRFQTVCIRWDARIRELYQEGYKIVNESVNGNGVVRYILLEEPKEKLEKPKHAIEILLDEINNRHNGSITAEDLARLVKSKGLNVVRAYGAHKKA